MKQPPLDPIALARRLDALTAELRQLAEAIGAALLTPRGTTETEQAVLAVLNETDLPLPSTALARRIGRPYDSWFRNFVTGLRRQGLVVYLQSPRQGYWLTARPKPAPSHWYEGNQYQRRRDQRRRPAEAEKLRRLVVASLEEEGGQRP